MTTSPTRRFTVPALTGAVVAVAALALSPLTVGSAAKLDVRVAAPLQVIIVDDVEVETPPAPVMRTISVVARRFNSGNTPSEVGGSPTTTDALVPDGQRYRLSWSGSTVVPCASVDHTVAPGNVEALTDPASADGSFLATADTTHEFCARTGNGAITISVVAP